VLSIVALGGVKDELDAAITDLRPVAVDVAGEHQHPSRGTASTASTASGGGG
jgi:hypothetical protein